MILRLDFDGVMHPLSSAIEPKFCRLELLEAWFREHPSVDVVITSSWRQVQSVLMGTRMPIEIVVAFLDNGIGMDRVQRSHAFVTDELVNAARACMRLWPQPSWRGGAPERTAKLGRSNSEDTLGNANRAHRPPFETHAPSQAAAAETEGGGEGTSSQPSRSLPSELVMERFRLRSDARFNADSPDVERRHERLRREVLHTRLMERKRLSRAAARRRVRPSVDQTRIYLWRRRLAWLRNADACL